MSALNIDRQLACDANEAPALATLQRWANAVASCTQAQGDVCVRLVEEAEIQSLNQQFRKQDKVTNVLSFPGATPPSAVFAQQQELDDEPRHLGDIAICSAQVQREAHEQGKPLSAHYAHILVHGLLHLLGYDHIDDAEADAMETLEIRILATLDVSDPYQSDSINGRIDDHIKLSKNTSAN